VLDGSLELLLRDRLLADVCNDLVALAGAACDGHGDDHKEDEA
jgi:hypothetical protein